MQVIYVIELHRLAMALFYMNFMTRCTILETRSEEGNFIIVLWNTGNTSIKCDRNDYDKYHNSSKTNRITQNLRKSSIPELIMLHEQM